MRNGLPAILKPIAGFERKGILPPFFVDQMDALTWLKRGHRSHSMRLPLGLQLPLGDSLSVGPLPNATPLNDARAVKHTIYLTNKIKHAYLIVQSSFYLLHLSYFFRR